MIMAAERKSYFTFTTDTLKSYGVSLFRIGEKIDTALYVDIDWIVLTSGSPSAQGMYVVSDSSSQW